MRESELEEWCVHDNEGEMTKRERERERTPHLVGRSCGWYLFFFGEKESFSTISFLSDVFLFMTVLSPDTHFHLRNVIFTHTPVNRCLWLSYPSCLLFWKRPFVQSLSFFHESWHKMGKKRQDGNTHLITCCGERIERRWQSRIQVSCRDVKIEMGDSLWRRKHNRAENTKTLVLEST